MALVLAVQRWSSRCAAILLATSLSFGHVARANDVERGTDVERAGESRPVHERSSRNEPGLSDPGSTVHGDDEPRHGHGHDLDDRATSQRRFEDADAWASHFEDPDRDAWQLPDSIVAVLVARDDLAVLDIGSATGYFPVRFARRVPRGIVFGADIEPAMVFYLNDRARREKLPNLVSILAEPDHPHVPQRVDLVFICNTYHHIDERVAYFEHLTTQLRPGARVVVVDFRIDSARGPAHKLPRDAVIREMGAAGYALAREHTFLPDQYFLVFRQRGAADR